jgi:hypothetical protein
MKRWVSESYRNGYPPGQTRKRFVEAMRATVTKYTREVRQAGDDGGAHDAARDGGWAILGDARSGHSGVVKALTELRTVFLRAVEGRRADPGAAKSEWARIVQRGAAKVSVEGEAGD